ncbi:uncharacterized protein LOC141719089 [Apium graveolens]|uniref:uncharacterized protein LOC141719089 n=1 Tax=Apium graveolens TaxID=4045 RepID=UPI003D7A48FB
MCVVDSNGYSGGITLIWRNKEEVDLKSYSKNHVDTVISYKEGQKYCLTGVYGEPNRAKTKDTWDMLRDMNNVTKQIDKRGGRLYPHWLLKGFQDCLDDCELIDMNLIGYPALVTSSFLQIFKDACLFNLEVRINTAKRFRFENAWLREPMCKQIMDAAWNGNGESSFYDKLFHCAETLHIRGQEITGKFKARIADCKKIIKTIRRRRDLESCKRVMEEKKKLAEIYTQQEIFWRQRSKQLWLREGDQNSKYFHAATKSRRKTNQISVLCNNQNQQIGWNDGLEDLMTRYFDNLFTASSTN